MLRLLSLLLVLTAAPVLADTCTVRVNGMDVVIDEDQFSREGLDPTRRETILSLPRRTISHALGNTPACRSTTVLVFLAELSDVYKTQGYCLDEGDDDIGFLLVPGERNYRGRCKRTTCQRFEAAADDLVRLSEGVTTIFGTPPDPDEIARSDSFGAVLISGSQRFLIRRLNNFASGAVLAALSAPGLATASAVTLVTVGSGVYLCKE